MLNITANIFIPRTDIKSNYRFPSPYSPAQASYDITDLVLENGIELNKRMEYDDFLSIAFDELQLTLIKRGYAKTILNLLNGGFLVLIDLSFNNKKLFSGFIDENSFIEDKAKEIITFRAESILKNLIEFWDNIPLPFYNFLPDIQPAILTTIFRNRNYQNVFEKALLEYQVTPRFFQQDIYVRLPVFFLFTPSIPPAQDQANSSLRFYFQNSYDNQAASYYRLQQFSYRYFNLDNIHYGRFSVKDFLIECAKYYGFSITIDKQNQIRFINKVEPYSQPYGNIVDLDDKILEDYNLEYDYKPKYLGLIFNVYLGIYGENWFIYYKSQSSSSGLIYKMPLFDTELDKELRDYLDLRYNLYSNLKENNAPRYIRGYIKNAAVFYTLTGVLGGDNNYYINLEREDIVGYFEKMLGSKQLARITAYGLDYQVGDYYKLENEIYILIEQRLNLNEESSELILRKV